MTGRFLTVTASLREGSRRKTGEKGEDRGEVEREGRSGKRGDGGIKRKGRAFLSFRKPLDPAGIASNIGASEWMAVRINRLFVGRLRIQLENVVWSELPSLLTSVAHRYFALLRRRGD